MFQLLISTIENNCMGAIDLTIAPDLNPSNWYDILRFTIWYPYFILSFLWYNIGISINFEKPLYILYLMCVSRKRNQY